MKVFVDESCAGAGKTREAIKRIVSAPCRTLFVTERKNAFPELEQRFRDAARKAETNPIIRHIHGDNHEGRGVVKRIAELPANYRLHWHVVVIATHEALLRSDFSGFAGWQIVIDEVPRFLDFEEKHTPLDIAFFQRHYILTPMKGNWSTVEPTAAGRALTAKDVRDDDSHSHLDLFHARVLEADHPHGTRKVMCNLPNWSSMKGKKVKWCWASTFSLRALAAFDRVELLGNRFSEDIGAQITSMIDGDRVEWETLPPPTIEGDAPSPSAPANDVAEIPSIEPVAKADPVDDGVRNRSQISDEPFLTALTSDWQGAHAIRKVLLSSGLKVAYGTIYKRMAKLAGAFPDMIEEAVEPVRWRLRSPSYIEPVADTLKKARLSAKGRRSKPAAPANDMPPAAITDVRERVEAATHPIMQMFSPVLHHANCFDAMKSIADGSIDLILTDPPYSTTGLDIDPRIDLTALWAEYRRIIKPTGTIIVFGSQPFTSRLIWEARDLFKHDLVWIKNRATGSVQARNRPLKQHEDVLVFSMGTTIQPNRTTRRYTYNALGQISAGMKKTRKGKHSAYLHGVKHCPDRLYEGTTNNPRTTLYCAKDEDHLHHFQKPLDLLEYLIRTYSREGDVVLDSFMGSGSTCVAAMRAGRRSIGVEMSRKYFAVAQHRVDAAIPALAEAA